MALIRKTMADSQKLLLGLVVNRKSCMRFDSAVFTVPLGDIERSKENL